MGHCGEEDKYNEVKDKFKRYKLDIIAGSETKLKERGEVMFDRVKWIISGVWAHAKRK